MDVCQPVTRGDGTRIFTGGMGSESFEFDEFAAFDSGVYDSLHHDWHHEDYRLRALVIIFGVLAVSLYHHSIWDYVGAVCHKLASFRLGIGVCHQWAYFAVRIPGAGVCMVTLPSRAAVFRGVFPTFHIAAVDAGCRACYPDELYF